MDSDRQLSCEKVVDRVGASLQYGKFTDCRFFVGSEPNQRTFACHRFILAITSPVFECMFYGNLPEKSDIILVTDVQPDIFQYLMDYIYSDGFKVDSFDEACELYYAAKKYMLPHLAKKCSDILHLRLFKNNAYRGYKVAKLYDDVVLLQKAMKLILQEPFVNIQISTFLDILDEDELQISSELVLFDALVKYAENCGIFVRGRGFSAKNNLNDDPANAEDTCESVNNELTVDSSSSDAPNGDGNKTGERVDQELIRKALKKIRFLTLTPQEFANGPGCSKMLQDHEVHAILLKISCREDIECPMPDGFTTSRKERFNSHMCAKCYKAFDWFKIRKLRCSSCFSFARIIEDYY